MEILLRIALIDSFVADQNIYIKETFDYLFFKAQTDSCAGLMHKRVKATQLCAAW